MGSHRGRGLLAQLDKPIVTGRTHQAVDFAPVVDEDETGDRSDAILASQVRILVDIHLLDVVAGVLQAVHGRLDLLAGPAPVGGEFEQDGFPGRSKRSGEQDCR
jgi:hypothetical protein